MLDKESYITVLIAILIMVYFKKYYLIRKGLLKESGIIAVAFDLMVVASVMFVVFEILFGLRN